MCLIPKQTRIDAIPDVVEAYVQLVVLQSINLYTLSHREQQVPCPVNSVLREMSTLTIASEENDSECGPKLTSTVHAAVQCDMTQWRGGGKPQVEESQEELQQASSSGISPCSSTTSFSRPILSLKEYSATGSDVGNDDVQTKKETSCSSLMPLMASPKRKESIDGYLEVSNLTLTNLKNTGRWYNVLS